MMKLHEAIYDYCFLARVSNSRSQVCEIVALL
jgi:hypothetical protein